MNQRGQKNGTLVDWAVVMRDDYPTACRTIRRLMPETLRGRYDAEDFVGEAIIELMAKSVECPEKGLASLVLVAKRRMIDVARSPRSRFVPLECEIVDRQPAAVLEQEANELRESLLRKVGDPAQRTVVDLRGRGHTLPEIAEMTGLGLRQLQRFWKEFSEANQPF